MAFCKNRGVEYQVEQVWNSELAKLYDIYII